MREKSIKRLLEADLVDIRCSHIISILAPALIILARFSLFSRTGRRLHLPVPHGRVGAVGQLRGSGRERNAASRDGQLRHVVRPSCTEVLAVGRGRRAAS
jgi:hypothetical protein